ncbi:hypothetical protein [Streptomyces sp. NPDC096012]|uniref:hypothetical protein n=1 Tax=Streptomyces sp. NPDC096012 TaxID=3155684 RepID=UPI00336AA2EE
MTGHPPSFRDRRSRLYVYAASTQEPTSVHDQRRTLLRDCVGRAVAPDRGA